MPYKDPAKKRAWSLNRDRRSKDWYWEYKQGLKCSKCGFSHPAALHFHHVDPSTKSFSRFARNARNREKLMKEIAKCIVLCANCHAIEHYEKDYKQTRI